MCTMFYSWGTVHIYAYMPYSKASKKYERNYLFLVFSVFGEFFALGWYNYYSLLRIFSSPRIRKINNCPPLFPFEFVSPNTENKQLTPFAPHTTNRTVILTFASLIDDTTEKLHIFLGRQQQVGSLGVHTTTVVQ